MLIIFIINHHQQLPFKYFVKAFLLQTPEIVIWIFSPLDDNLEILNNSKVIIKSIAEPDNFVNIFSCVRYRILISNTNKSRIIHSTSVIWILLNNIKQATLQHPD